jgi:hypothetical protein
VEILDVISTGITCAGFVMKGRKELQHCAPSHKEVSYTKQITVVR